MQSKRRTFLKMTGLSWLASAGILKAFGAGSSATNSSAIGPFATGPSGRRTSGLNSPDPGLPGSEDASAKELSIIGLYGPWAAGLKSTELPAFSFRRQDWKSRADWQKAARKRLKDRLAIPSVGPAPKPIVKKQYSYDGLHIEELTWQLPYGRATEAILLKPLDTKGPLPGILAFHDHGGNKYFGTKKITKTSAAQSALMEEHQRLYYGGFAWANEIARHGYVVLISDAFTFASRRVMIGDTPSFMHPGLSDRHPENGENGENAEEIKAYNTWASEHEHTMAKSLFSSGTTWPGVFFAEDRIALDILCAREDVDANRIGCGGLSGGGIRTVYMTGLDPRIKCGVTVGFMTTWKDLVLNKSFTHTWMTYVPLLPNELDFPEIMGLATPTPIMVLNNNEDELFTLDEMKRADQVLTSVYEKAHAADRYKCSFHPGPHKFDKQMQTEAFAWFDKWLSA